MVLGRIPVQPLPKLIFNVALLFTNTIPKRTLERTPWAVLHGFRKIRNLITRSKMTVITDIPILHALAFLRIVGIPVPMIPAFPS